MRPSAARQIPRVNNPPGTTFFPSCFLFSPERLLFSSSGDGPTCPGKNQEKSRNFFLQQKDIAGRKKVVSPGPVSGPGRSLTIWGHRRKKKPHAPSRARRKAPPLKSGLSTPSNPHKQKSPWRITFFSGLFSELLNSRPAISGQVHHRRPVS